MWQSQRQHSSRQTISPFKVGTQRLVARRFFIERQRALAEAARLLRQELTEPSHSNEIRQLSVTLRLKPLEQHPSALQLLGIACVFRGAVLRELLKSLAREEGILNIDNLLELLIHNGLLQRMADAATLRLPSVCRPAIHSRQEQTRQEARHRAAAREFQQRGAVLDCAWHLARGGQTQEALVLLFDHFPVLERQVPRAELLQVLDDIGQQLVQETEKVRLKLLTAYVSISGGDRESQLQYTRQLIAAAAEPEDKARGFMWLATSHMGFDNQLASRFFAEAERILPPNHQFRFELGGRRAMLLHQQNRPEEATAVLRKLLADRTGASAEIEATLRAILANALICQDQLDDARRELESALLLNLQENNESGVSYCYSVLADLYLQQNEPERTIHHAELAAEIARRMDYQSGLAVALRIKGEALTKMARFDESIAVLNEGLNVASAGQWWRTALICHARLAEAHSRNGDGAAGRCHWLAAMDLGRRLGAPELVDSLLDLRQELPELHSLSALDRLSEHEAQAVAFILKQTTTSATSLAEHLGVSRATAKRLVNKLVASGVIARADVAGKARYSMMEEIAAPAPGVNRENPLPPAAIRALALAGSGKVTVADLVRDTGISRASAQRLLARLIAAGRLLRTGKGRASSYRIP